MLVCCLSQIATPGGPSIRTSILYAIRRGSDCGQRLSPARPDGTGAQRYTERDYMRARGFTLIELLVVIAIIGILSSV
jgi:prepilin-type N-terminal cleavage/methylation domain-containing protein